MGHSTSLEPAAVGSRQAWQHSGKNKLGCQLRRWSNTTSGGGVGGRYWPASSRVQRCGPQALAGAQSMGSAACSHLRDLALAPPLGVGDLNAVFLKERCSAVPAVGQSREFLVKTCRFAGFARPIHQPSRRSRGALWRSHERGTSGPAGCGIEPVLGVRIRPLGTAGRDAPVRAAGRGRASPGG